MPYPAAAVSHPLENKTQSNVTNKKHVRFQYIHISEEQTVFQKNPSNFSQTNKAKDSGQE